MAAVSDLVDDVQYRLNDAAGVRYTNVSATYFVQNALLEELRYLCFIPILNEFLFNSEIISGSEVTIDANGEVLLPTCLRIIGGTIEGRQFTQIWNEHVPLPINPNDTFNAPTTESPVLWIKNKKAYPLPLKAWNVNYHKVTFQYIETPATTTVIPEALQETLIAGAASRLAYRFQEIDLGAECRAAAEKALSLLVPQPEKA